MKISRKIICSFIFIAFLVTVTGIGQALSYAYPPQVDKEFNVEYVGGFSGERAAVDVVGNYAYVADGTGIYIVDVSNPSSPTLLGSCKNTEYAYGDYAYGVSVSGNYAYVADWYNGLVIFDVSNPSSPTLVKSYKNVLPTSVSVIGNYAYVANGTGIYIVDIENPSSAILIGSYKTAGEANDVSVSGKYAYVADGTGIDIVDVSNPSSPNLVGSYKTAGEANDVSVSGKYAYVADGTGIDIVDVSNPSSPILIGSYFPVLTYDYDFVAPGRPVKVPGQAIEVSVFSNYVYILGNYGLVIVDVTDPSAPTLVGGYRTSYNPISVADHFSVSGNYVYVGYSTGGFVVLKTDIQNQELTVGQGASTPEITQKFIDAYNRSGGLSVLGNPTTKVYKMDTLGFEVQDFPGIPGAPGGVIMYNPIKDSAFYIHGAIWDKYYNYADKAKLGYVASDEGVAAILSKTASGSSPLTKNGNYTKFETGTIHWISDRPNENLDHSQRGKSFVTYGGLDEIYTQQGGTYSELGFPIMDQETKAEGYDYCEFDGGNISYYDSLNYKIQYHKYISYSDFSFIQITDTHINGLVLSNELTGTPSVDPSVYTLTGIVDDLNKHYSDAKFVLVTGDLVTDASDVNFHKFNEIMKSLKIDAKYVPGNHDRRNDPTGTIFTQDLKRYAKFISPQNDRIEFEESGFKFIGLDSKADLNVGINWGMWTIPAALSKDTTVWDHTPESYGLDTDQINYLNKLSPSQPKIIFMHHPAIAAIGNNDSKSYPSISEEPIEPNNNYGGNDGCIAFNRSQFIEYCKANNVQNVVTGHSHKDVILSANGEKRDETSTEYPIFIQTAAGVDGDYRIFNVIDGNVRSYSSSEPVLRSRTSADLKCPANLRVYDSQNRCTGLNSSGEAERSIPNSFYIGRYNYSDPNDREDIILYGTNENYRFEVVANLTEEQKNSPEIETFNLTIEQVSEDTNRTISYRNVPLTENTIATLPINQTIASYAMEIDSNGDGIKDETREPDSVNIDGVETIIVNDISPASITNLQSTNSTTWINWTWTNPSDPDFNHTEIYLNGIFQTNTSAVYFNTTGLQPETVYTIGTRTIDNDGNLNETWVNSTATTGKNVVSDVEKPVIQSVVLLPANTIASSKINVTVNAMDNVGVVGVTASNAPMANINGFWQGTITAPSKIGSYSLLINASDAAGNTAQSTANYKVVAPIGSLGVGVAPKTTTAPTSGKTIDYTVKIKSIQNFDDVVRVNVTMDGLPVAYQMPLGWFDWNSQTVNVASNSTISLPIKLTIPPGQSAGRKAFKVSAKSTSWITTAFDSGIITIA